MTKKLGEHLWTQKANTIITLAAAVGGLVYLYHFVKAPLDQIAAKSALLNQVAIDVDDIKTKGSRPMQEMAIRITAVIKDVNELKSYGAVPLQLRIGKIETVLDFIVPTIKNIDTKLDRYVLTNRNNPARTNSTVGPYYGGELSLGDPNSNPNRRLPQ